MMLKYYTVKQRCVVYFLKICAVFYILEVGKTPTGLRSQVYAVTEKYCHLQTQSRGRSRKVERNIQELKIASKLPFALPTALQKFCTVTQKPSVKKSQV